jgi:hypothetical protein
MLFGDSPISVEQTILTRAHQTVQLWRRWRANEPFPDVVAEMESVYWASTPNQLLQREAFRQVTQAIF